MEPISTPDSKPERPVRLREKEGLRIQAAAVAAQQAALTEEERRLESRRAALEQQESQLAAHLKEKHRRLVEIRDQARQERTALKEERTAYEQRVQEMSGELTQARAEVTEEQKQAQTQRLRLVKLHRGMKRRWHRHWSVERAVMRRREEELDGERRALQHQADLLEETRAELMQARLRFNGDVELGRRQLQDQWNKLRQEQEQSAQRRAQEDAPLEERARGLDQRQDALSKGELELKKKQQTLAGLQLEAEGLESRIHNQRQKMLEQGHEAARLEVHLRDLQTRVQGRTVPESALPRSEDVAAPAILEAELEQMEARLRQVEEEQQPRLLALERLTGELSDQREQLHEQYDRLLQVEKTWVQDRDDVAAELEALAMQLQAREQTVEAGEHHLEEAVIRCRQRQQEIDHLQQHLESRQGRLNARTTAWVGERDRQLAELHTRDKQIEQREAAMIELRRRWQERRQMEVDRLRTGFAAWAKLRQSAIALREEWVRRRAALNRERQIVTDQALAVKQYQQECLDAAADPVVAAKRLERLRSRWAALSASADKVLEQDRQALEKEVARLEERYSQMHRWAEQIAHQELDLSSRETSLEQSQAQGESEAARLRLELHSLQLQRVTFERQIAELTQEVEHLAVALFEGGEKIPSPVVQAA